MDFTKYPDSGRFYTGAERKKGILIQGQPYILKFRKNSHIGLKYNHISEYLGSHLFQILGVECQDTYLGTYRGEEVVAIRDFLGKNETFVPFNDVGDSSLEQNREIYQYSYVDICKMLHANKKITDVEGTEESFWDIYLIDAWIGNFDRHGSNWGFIKQNNKYRLAPVFDNGSSLFPALNTDEKIMGILGSETEMQKRIYEFPTSQIRLDGKKSSYYDVISSLRFEACNQALVRIVPEIRKAEWEKIIESIGSISSIRKDFYREMLKRRYEIILEASYQKLCERRAK